MEAPQELSSKYLQASVVQLQDSIEKGIDSGLLESGEDASTLRHFFVPVTEEYGCGMYTRELTVPKGMTFVGKLHRHPHMVFLLKGELMVVSEAGRESIKAPYTWVSPSGAKRAFYALEDSILTNVHLTKTVGEDNLEIIEDEVISPTYTDMGLPEPDLTLLENK